MNKLKVITITSIALLSLSSAFADDYGFSSFGDDAISSVSSIDTSSSDNSFSFSSFSDASYSEDASLVITGSASTSSRVYLQDYDTDSLAGETDISTELELDMSYSADNSELVGTLLLNEDTLETYTEDIINELTYRAYTNDFIFEAGKTKIVWGRGDKVHVLDLICANDYTDFINEDYIDRRIAENEFDVTWNIPSSQNLSLQLVFTPGMTVDRLATDGRWESSSVSSLESYITTYATTMINNSSSYADAIIAAEAYSDLDTYYTDTDSLEYSQYGARLTGSAEKFDWGAEYYYGHYKTPSVSYNTSTGITLDYDQLQAFGFDGETVVCAYTLRNEFAYYLTDDLDGDDASVHNNSVNWVVGVDRDLPWGEMNINIQDLGSYILNYDNVSSAYDIDYNSSDTAIQNTIVLNLSDSILAGSLNPQISTLWTIETGDVIIMPEFDYRLKDDFTVNVSASFIYGDDDSNYYAYQNNSFVEFSADYAF